MNNSVEQLKEKGYKSMTGHIALTAFFGGIYGLVWKFQTTNVTNADKTHEQRKAVTELLLSLFVPFYATYWNYCTAKRVLAMADAKGVAHEPSILYTILSLVGPLEMILLQMLINDVADAATSNATSPADKIAELKKMLDQGLISKADFDAKKKAILGV